MATVSYTSDGVVGIRRVSFMYTVVKQFVEMSWI